MRLLTYYVGTGSTRPGLRDDTGDVHDLNGLLSVAGMARVHNVRDFLDRYNADIAALTMRLPRGRSSLTLVGSVNEVRLAAPIEDPEKVLCVGLNYLDHVGETGRTLPEYPDVFTKFARSLTGPFDPIRAEVSEKLDFEGELALVIGRETRDISETEAKASIAGVMVMNDITARDLQSRGTQWVLGKSLESATPCGPELVTLDEISDLGDIDLTTRVNDIELQRSNTRHFLFSPAQVVSYISRVVTLVPGDIIATGTPAGIGAKRVPPVWLRPGDQVEVEVAGIGVLRNAIW
jgi:2-keto-4-pentenoate hydratase/2-oxohepta-3-ene-1,7-dioic acid hydratase in catechol pathway